MKNRGLTLIELLVVIVVLGLIALIITPVVMDVIKDSEIETAKFSGANYVTAINNTIMRQDMKGDLVEDGRYIIQSDGSLCSNDNCTDEQKIKIEVTGNKPSEGIIYIEDQLVADGSTIVIDGYVANQVNGETKVGDFGRVASNFIEQTTIKYDPVANQSCASGTTCYEWYVLEGNENEYAYVTLIMNKNITNDTVAWAKSGTNSDGPVSALSYLENYTNKWQVEAMLPTYDQIYNINDSAVGPQWLCTNLDNDNSTKIVTGYWTSTPDTDTTNTAYSMYFNCEANSNLVVSRDDRRGIRPVVRVLKENLK